MGVKTLSRVDREHRFLGGRFTAAPTVIAINYDATNYCTSNLGIGAFTVSADVDCYFLLSNGAGTTLSNGATANGHYLAAGMREIIRTCADYQNIHVTTALSAGYAHVSEHER